MREIRFRVLPNWEDEWYYFEVFHSESCASDLENVRRDTLGQYTGLKDKNGVEIYEGDILKLRYFPIGISKDVMEYYKYGVVDNYGFISWKINGTTILDNSRASSYHKTKKEKYSHPTVGSKYIDRQQLHIHGTKHVEVIGNIYENPELL